MTVDGIEYKKHVGVIYDMTADLPQVGQVTSIFIVNHNTVVFEVTCFSSVYIEHYRTYTLQAIHCEKMLTVHDLILPNPVHIRRVSVLSQCKSIILPHHVNV